MTDDTALFSVPLIHGSLVACRSTASASARLILSISRSQSCRPRRVAFQREFAVVLVQFSDTGFTETPLTEVCSAKVRPRYLVFHQHFSKGARHHPRGPLHSDMNVKRTVTAIWGPRDCSHSEHSMRNRSFRPRNSPDVRRTCLDRRPLLGDNHRFRRRVRHSNEHVAPLAGLASMYKIAPQIPESVCCLFVHAVCVLASFRRCRCHTCSSDTQRTPPASTVFLHQAGL